MNSKAFIVLGVLFVAAVFALMTNKNESPDFEFLQTPTPSSMPINIQTNNILGEETKTEIPSQPVKEIQAEIAVIETTKGKIEIVLFNDATPNTVKNFITKADSGFYKNLTFHRVEDWVVQGGDPERN